MKMIRFCAAGALAVSLSACAVQETASRNAPMVDLVPQALESMPFTASLDVAEIVVVVPRSLRVSEANLFFPGGDIVWREDPAGDRYEQVRAILEAGLTAGVNGLRQGEKPVRMLVEVTRFHALTEKARYTTGGVHDIDFKLSFQDIETGAMLGEPRLVEADLKAYGGAAALAAERRGETQKYRITNHIAAVIQQELISPGATAAEEIETTRAITQL